MDVETGVGRLHVESLGDGPAVLMWPSLFCDGRTLLPQADVLAADHRVLVVDGPGHGRSGSSGRRFTLEDCSDAVLQVLDAAGVDRAWFIGSAWGGHVGVVTVVRAPERFCGLVLMNAPMQAWTGAVRARLWLLYQLYRTLGPRAFLVAAVEGAQLSPAVRSAHPERAALVADCLRSADRGALALAIRSAMLDRPELVSRLPSVRVPTLFITGALDSIFTVEQARAQAAAIPRCRFEVIEGSAHQSGLEHPERVNPLIRDFLRSPVPGPESSPASSPA